MLQPQPQKEELTWVRETASTLVSRLLAVAEISTVPDFILFIARHLVPYYCSEDKNSHIDATWQSGH